MPAHATIERPDARELDLVFQALADPTRRAVVERLGAGPTSTSELARPFPMALPSFMGHLELLARSGLITSRKQGRVRTYELVPTRLSQVQEWLAEQHELWTRRLDQLDDFLLAEASAPPAPPKEQR